MSGLYKKIFLLLCILAIVPIAAKAETLENKTIEENVFLKGKYIQIGINANGALGTVPLKKESLSPDDKTNISLFATTELESGLSLGMRYNQFGWDSGENATTGDFLVNRNNVNTTNSSKDTFVIAYEVGGHEYLYMIRGDGYKSEGLTVDPIVTSKDTINRKVEAIVTMTTAENIEIKLIYWFHEDSSHFHTDVEIKNNTNERVRNIRVLKLMNPDQDKLINRTSLTYNKVISVAKEGNYTNHGYSMVAARGETSLDGMFYISFDQKSRPGINSRYYNATNTTSAPNDLVTLDLLPSFNQRYDENFPYTASTDSMSIFYQGVEENGYDLRDSTISMYIPLDDIPGTATDTNPDKLVKTQFATSLDNDIIQGVSEVLEEHNANILRRTDHSITLAAEAKEYKLVMCTSMDENELDEVHCPIVTEAEGYISFSSPQVYEYTNLEPGRYYRIYYRINGHKPHEGSILTSTKTSPKDAVDLQAVIVTEDSITIKGDHGYEYSIDGGLNWQTSETFRGLNPNTEYTFIGRAEETYNDMPGKVSKELKVRTLTKDSNALDGVERLKIDVKIVDAVPTILLNKAHLYEAIKDNEEIVELLANTDNIVTVVFDVIKLYPTDEELDDLKPYMKKKQIAYAFDVELKVYVNGNHVLDLANTNKKVTFKMIIPDKYKKKNREFNIIRKHIIKLSEPAEYEVLNDADSSDDTITIENDLFSEFYVTCEKENVVNPKTGVNNYLVLIFISLIGIVLVYKEYKNKSLFKLS